MPRDLCKKLVETEDESFASFTNPRELLADENHFCEVPAGFPFPSTTLYLRNNCTFSMSNISFSTYTVAELFEGDQLYNNPWTKESKTFNVPRNKQNPLKSQPFPHGALLLPHLTTTGPAVPWAVQGLVWRSGWGCCCPNPALFLLIPRTQLTWKPPSSYTYQLALHLKLAILGFSYSTKDNGVGWAFILCYL